MCGHWTVLTTDYRRIEKSSYQTQNFVKAFRIATWQTKCYAWPTLAWRLKLGDDWRLKGYFVMKFCSKYRFQMIWNHTEECCLLITVWLLVLSSTYKNAGVRVQTHFKSRTSDVFIDSLIRSESLFWILQKTFELKITQLQLFSWEPHPLIWFQCFFDLISSLLIAMFEV